jgi:hypothetical protein
MPAGQGQNTPRLVIGDPIRNLGVVWSIDPAGILEGDTKGGTGPGGVTFTFNRVDPTLVRGEDVYQRRYYFPFRLPDGSGTGPYSLTAGGRTWTFTAEAALTPRPFVTAPAGSSPAYVSALLAGGFNVQLEPGVYDWSDMVIVPGDNYRVTGYGAVVRGGAAGPLGQYCLFYVQGKDFTLEGGTYYPTAWVVSNPSPVSPYPDAALGVAVSNVTIGPLGLIQLWNRFSNSGAYITDVAFERGQMGAPPEGLYLRCLFRGQPPIYNSFRRALGVVGEIAMLDCVFDGTDRGLVFQPQTETGDITDNFFHGLRIQNVASETNGCESILAEGTANFDRNMFLHVRVVASVGPTPNLDCPAHDNYFQDMTDLGPGGVYMPGGTDHDQTGNKFESCEWHGPVSCGSSNVTANSWEFCGFLWSGPSRANQSGQAPSGPLVCCTATPDSGNTMTTCHWFLGPGLSPQTNFIVSGGSTFNGSPYPP